MSTPGESRSWGSVSQDGNIATASPKTPRSSARKVIGFPAGRRNDQQRPPAGQRAGDEQSCAGRTDQRQFPGSVASEVDESLQRRRTQRQLDKPRDRGICDFWPPCGHDDPIVWGPTVVNFRPSAVKDPLGKWHPLDPRAG